MYECNSLRKWNNSISISHSRSFNLDVVCRNRRISGITWCKHFLEATGQIILSLWLLKKNFMKALKLWPFTLELRHTFTIFSDNNDRQSCSITLRIDEHSESPHLKYQTLIEHQKSRYTKGQLFSELLFVKFCSVLRNGVLKQNYEILKPGFQYKILSFFNEYE